MNRAAVIGDPIAQSKSPLIHGFWLERLGIAGEYEALHVTPAELPQFLEDLPYSGLAGVNVTIPHKERAIGLVDRLTVRAREVGATNLITVHHDGLCGDNSDVEGVMAALKSALLSKEKAVLIGAGGAARAAMYALRERGVNEVHILTRTAEKGEALLREFGLKGMSSTTSEAAEAMREAAVVINASPLGMIGKEAMPASIIAGLGKLRREALVFDMVYVPLQTALLAAAQSEGFAVSDGLTTLIEQARPAFRAFFGHDSPCDPKSDRLLRELLLS